MLSRWSKYIPGFLIGITVGVVGCVAMYFLSSLTIPFTERALSFEANAHMKMFVQEMSAFDGGWDDGDTADKWFSFRTRIAAPEEYFQRVDAVLADSDWKVVDEHPTFRLYASPWRRGERKEVTLTIVPQQGKVFFEQKRRYDGSRE